MKRKFIFAGIISFSTLSIAATTQQGMPDIPPGLDNDPLDGAIIIKTGAPDRPPSISTEQWIPINDSVGIALGKPSSESVVRSDMYVKIKGKWIIVYPNPPVGGTLRVPVR